MKNFIICTSVLLLTFSTVSAQESKDDKYLEKANKMIEDGKYDDADKYLDGILKKNPEYGKCWDLLDQLRFKAYEDAKSEDNLFSGKVVVTTKGKKGKTDTLSNDSLSQKLTAMLSQMKPSKIAFNKFIYTLREGSAFCNTSAYSCFFLRKLFVDIDVDSAVGDKARQYFDDAEKEFQNKSYDKAAKLYKQAIAVQPNYYKANMYLGDAYYFSAEFTDALNVFKGCVEKFPFLVEPRKYLIDTYMKQGMYSNAIEESIKAMSIYPDNTIVQRLEESLAMSNKKIDIKWTPRMVLPNRFEADTLDLNAYRPDKEPAVKGPWKYYKAAFDKIKSYCNSDGIITKSNSLTQSKYMEVYCWEEMLANSNDASLDEARKMQKAGYLECYVLVTCFHHDFYEQYKDFAAKNKTKITEYYNKFIN